MTALGRGKNGRSVGPPIRCAAVAALVLASFDAAAQGSLAEARAEYEAGAAAYDRKDYATAAIRFARADDIVPRSTALQLAMASALRQSDAALAMNLVARAEARAVDGALADLARRLRRRFAAEAGRIHVTCPSGVRCAASVDGEDFDPALDRWVAPGVHRVVVRGEGSVEREVQVAAGGRVEVAPSADDLSPPPAPAPEPAPRAEPAAGVATPAAPARTGRGISPVFFWSGVALTGVAAGTATALTVESARRREEFLANRSAETAAAGEAAQLRAGIGWGVAGALLVTTVVLAIVTDFRGASQEPVARGPDPWLPKVRIARGSGEGAR